MLGFHQLKLSRFCVIALIELHSGRMAALTKKKVVPNLLVLIALWVICLMVSKRMWAKRKEKSVGRFV